MVANGSRSFFADFRDFIMKGNVIDLAVAVILGGAFNGIVNSLVQDIITPAILSPAIKAAGVDKLSDLSISGIKYGLFLSSVINFVIIAFCLFSIIRSFETVKRKLIRKEELAIAEAEAIETQEVKPEILAQENLTKAIETLTEVINNKSVNH
ncbi:large conductance mechanosensitive channel protein MscL [Geminocystis sp. GBBB08]|uniref:large conductance mechanosensitive channel protein MscL n=1 Tax=Geminocystis sp. GBBB08 TaxID=2604140 RepID=UPI0027E277E8|nr:large conductance mechanosensitive channel protein MscL [Geminocystis sp. GBBB08]MBL1210112.1 large conductance mechanosensitive channel protein MscL [Geminocystis sp. GBBB08]